MNICELLKRELEGKEITDSSLYRIKLRKKSQDKGKYIIFEYSEIHNSILPRGYNKKRNVTLEGKLAALGLEELLAEDWELFDEKAYR